MPKMAPITNPEELPIVLHTKHVQALIGCCQPNAMALIREGQAKGWFKVVWAGNQPRVSRDGFLKWFNSVETDDIEAG